MAFINNIATALPVHKHAQQDILQYMLQAYAVPNDMHGKVEALYAKCGINYRYSVLPDFNIKNNKTLFAAAAPVLKKSEQSSSPVRLNE